MSTIFKLYSSWDKYGSDVPFDDDQPVSLSSYRQLDQIVSPTGRPILSRSLQETPSPAAKKVFFRLYTPKNEEQMGNSAVMVRNAHFQYGKGKKAVNALRGIDLTVPEGGIYGLLGPSGCGKTSLLRCIVGRLQPDEGEIRIFGKIPGSAGSKVPGSQIGYMPQEIALFPDFTIEETLLYFGNLYRLRSSMIKQRTEFLLKFLDLPEKTRLVGNLSGGQKRRVSLAASLIHSPPLLILDEPTVGVDPLLRQSIWDHLVTLTKTEKLTVIITTHYIEEARAAQVVGLMRFGRILIEANPEKLLKRYNFPTLEEVFLKLCQLDANGIVVVDYDKQAQFANDVVALSENKPDLCDVKEDSQMDLSIEKKKLSNSLLVDIETPVKDLFSKPAKQTKFDNLGFNGWFDSYARTSALFWKNITRLRRNMPVLLFQFLLPSIEVILFCACIGQDPFNLKVAVYNEENLGKLSYWFLDTVPNKTIQFQDYDSFESALDAVKYGDAWAAVIIGKNFTSAMQSRVLLGGEIDNETVEQSNIQLYTDSTNQIIRLKIYETLTTSFVRFGQKVLNMMGQSTSLLELPIVLQAPIYGEKSPSFTEFMAPGVLLSIAFLAAVALTALAFVMERKEGLLERSLVAGVTSTEFMISHILTQLLVLTVQVALLLIFTFLVFDIPSRGPFFWVIVLTLLQGTCGMAFGLMISSLCEEENSATMLALGSFYPNLLLSGTVWPTQAMPDVMRYFSYVLPQTIPIESMRYILSRGWDPSYYEVGLGFIVTILWIVFFLILAVIIFRSKK